MFREKKSGGEQRHRGEKLEGGEHTYASDRGIISTYPGFLGLSLVSTNQDKPGGGSSVKMRRPCQSID